MFDLKKDKVVHDIEPVVSADSTQDATDSGTDRTEPSLNIDPPEALEPVVQKVGLGWYPGVKASTATGRAPQPGDHAKTEVPVEAGPAIARDHFSAEPAEAFDGVQSVTQARDPIPRQAEQSSVTADETTAETVEAEPVVADASDAHEPVHDASTAATGADQATADAGKQDIPQFGLPVDTRNSSPKIGAILVAHGKMNEQQVQQVLAQQEREPGMRFGEICVRNRFVSQKDVDDALASQFGFTSNSQSASNLAPEIVVAHNPFSPFSEALRGLRSQLMLRWFDGSPQQGALAMTSVDRADGKSFICSNLGVVFSQLGEKTLIIDADLRNSTQHKKFGVQNRMGLSGLLSGRAGVEEILAVPGLSNLAVLPSGPLPPNPQELLGRESFSQFLAAMSSTFDVILIDTPSAQQASDAQVVAQRARAALIVGRKDKTKSSEIGQLGQVMTSSGVKLLGATLNTY